MGGHGACDSRGWKTPRHQDSKDTNPPKPTTIPPHGSSVPPRYFVLEDIWVGKIKKSRRKRPCLGRGCFGYFLNRNAHSLPYSHPANEYVLAHRKKSPSLPAFPTCRRRVCVDSYGIISHIFDWFICLSPAFFKSSSGPKIYRCCIYVDYP